MRKILILIAFIGACLSSCKKDVAEYGDLAVSGYGPYTFVSGDAISIYGKGFDPDPEGNIVTFNGVKGEVATATANRLQVIVPLLTTSGSITVQVHGKTVVSNLKYTLLNLLQGTITSNTILTPDKKYLLRGNVIFQGKLLIQAGTVIYGEKATHATLTVSDVDFEGTADKPVVFTSDQPAGKRQPGDWTGIVLNYLKDNSITNPTGNPVALPNGIIKYVRIEYAGYHLPGAPGQAISLNMDGKSTLRYIQASYSQGDGFLLTNQPNSVTGSTYTGDALVSNLVALACQGTDFHVVGNGIAVQYALGLKDPYSADVLQGQGLWVDQSAANTKLTNFTLIGYNPTARNMISMPVGVPLSNNAGRGVQLGSVAQKPAFDNSYNGGTYGVCGLFNSIIAANWLAGISLMGAGGNFNLNGVNATLVSPWNYYDQSIVVRNNYILGTATANLPFRGGALGKENFTKTNTGFEKNVGDATRNLFATYNDTTRVLDFAQPKDDLGIAGLADLNNLNHPVLLPAAGSPVLTGAKFPAGSLADNPLFNKDITFVGAFGTENWATPWCNFNPQTTNY